MDIQARHLFVHFRVGDVERGLLLRWAAPASSVKAQLNQLRSGLYGPVDSLSLAVNLRFPGLVFRDFDRFFPKDLGLNQPVKVFLFTCVLAQGYLGVAMLL